ncbi:6692_t:CDS:1, partial [Dentiscutata heterogama]
AEHDINERIAKTGKYNILNRVIDAERPYDFISMIFEGEMPIQWGCHVRITLQKLKGPE